MASSLLICLICCSTWAQNWSEPHQGSHGVEPSQQCFEFAACAALLAKIGASSNKKPTSHLLWGMQMGCTSYPTCKAIIRRRAVIVRCPNMEVPSNHHWLKYFSILPARTAQGGGARSFKDRTPMGKVRCCESWMVERIHCDRKVVGASACLSANLSAWPTDWLTNYLAS